MRIIEVVSDRVAVLTQLLLAVRHHIIGNRTSHWGDCELVAEAFLSSARGNGLVLLDPNDPLRGGGFIIWGWLSYNPEWTNKYRQSGTSEPGKHQWVEIDDMIYDGTADQFGYRDQEVLVTGADDPRYHVFRKTDRTFTRATPFEKD